MGRNVAHGGGMRPAGGYVAQGGMQPTGGNAAHGGDAAHVGDAPHRGGMRPRGGCGPRGDAAHGGGCGLRARGGLGPPLLVLPPPGCAPGRDTLGGPLRVQPPPSPAARCLPALTGRSGSGAPIRPQYGAHPGSQRAQGGHPAPWGGQVKGSGAGDPHPGELHHVGCDGPSVAAQSPTCHIPAVSAPGRRAVGGPREKKATDQGLERRWLRGPRARGGGWAAGLGDPPHTHTPPHLPTPAAAGAKEGQFSVVS